MKRKKTHMKNIKTIKKLNIKKLLLIVLFIATIFGIYPALSKYISATPEQIITILTKYHINYQTSGGRILEPEKFNTYVSQSGKILPVEGEVTRPSYDFIGWYGNNNFTGEAITEIKSGDYGDKLFFASWEVSRHTLTVKTKDTSGNIITGLPEGYNIVKGKDDNGNDNIISLGDSGTATIGKNEIVSIRAPYSEDMESGGFSFDDENIVVTNRYEEGSQYIYYDFYMPRGDITLTFNNELEGYIDISKSSIIFEENVNTGSITQNGFWYKSTIKGMTPALQDSEKGNFYVWDYSQPFYVTSKNKETQNQLILVNAIDVYFKECKLVATNAYSSEIIGRKMGSVLMELKAGSLEENAPNEWKEYGNIIIDNLINKSYTVNFYIENTNIIASIFQAQYFKDSVYSTSVNIYGDNKTDDILYFGSIWGNMELEYYGLAINEYSSYEDIQQKYPDNSEYTAYTNTINSTKGCISYNNCNLNISNKRIFSGYGFITFTSVTAEIGSTRSAYHTSVSTNSNIHINGEAYVYYYGYSVIDSIVIIDGSLRSKGYETGGTSINKGTLIVKGNMLDAQALTITDGNLIANAIAIGSSLSINGSSKIITNQILNLPYGRPTFNTTTGEYSSFSGMRALAIANKNYDNYLFNTYANSSTTPNTFNFNGGNIYLYGYYELEDGSYSTTFTTKSENNPLKEIITKYENNGFTDLTHDYLMSKLEYSDTECIILGDSSKSYRTVSLSGSNIYAGGDITFFDETTISNGTIYTKGILSSKKKLTINGGTITANEVGNTYNLSTTSDGTNEWASINISNAIINTDYIGPTTKTMGYIESKSYVRLGDNVTLNKKISDDNQINIATDIYVNYLYGSSFDKNNTINNLRFNGKINEGSNCTINNLLLIEPIPSNNTYTFNPPLLLSDSSAQKWKYGSLSGVELQYISDSGYANGNNSSEKIYNESKFNLYAVKEQYNLTVYGTGYSATSNNTPISFTDNVATVNSDSEIILNLTERSMLDKTIIWYTDDSGLLHNAITNDNAINNDNGTITFVMPCADTEIWITDELTLDLYSYNIGFLSNGFTVELDSNNRRKDSVFEYKGNIIVSQSNISTISHNVTHGNIKSSVSFTVKDSNNNNSKTTSNRIVFESGSDVIERTITLSKIYQLCSVKDYGITIADGENIKLNISGAIQLFPIYLTSNSSLTIEGNDNNKDFVHIKFVGEQDAILIGNKNGETGSVTIKNLWIAQYSSRIVYGKYKSNTNNVLYDNAKLDVWVYWRTSLSYNMNNITFLNSDLKMNTGGDTASPLFTNCNDITLTNSSLEYTSGGERTYNSLFYGMNNMYINGTSSVIYNYRNSTAGYSKYELISYGSYFADKVEISDSATVSIDHRIRLEKVVLNDNARLEINKLGEQQADIDQATYLLCPDIEVNGNAHLYADNIIVSGFYYGTGATTKSQVLDYLKNDSNSINGSTHSGLVINGGTVTANNFIGGDINGKITINGGTINSNKIGTIGNLYGYAKYLPVVGEEYVYTYSKIPSKGTTVTINGGTVNVSDNGYLGGMNAQADINGGTVNLGENAIIGMNETDTTKLVNSITSQGNVPNELVDINITGGTITGSNGYISTPYSTLDIDSISSNPSINVKDILADNGTINIKGTADHYDNPLGEENRVGTIVNNNLIAQNIEISNGAVVYADNAISKTNTSSATGYLRVGENSYLYTKHYGTDGYGTSTITNNGTLVGNRHYTIQYVLNDTYTDPAENTNPTNYEYGNTITLEAPTRFGYTFDGWYDNEGNEITEITSTDTGDKILNARWTEKKVKFAVSIKAEAVGLTAEEFALQVDEGLGSLNATGDTFTYTSEVEVSYHELLNTGLLLSNYNLKDYAAASAKIDNTTLNPDDTILNLTSSGATVTREIMEYYLNNSSEPIEISVCEFIQMVNE